MYNLCHFAGQQQWCGQFFPDNGARLNHARGQVLTDFGAPDCSAFCSAFVQRTFQEARDWGCLTPSPLCLDDPRGFGGNGRQWAKWLAREKWLRAAKTAPQLKIFFWKDFFSNTTNNASCWDIHSNHFDLFLFFHWWLIGGVREMKNCLQGVWDWECHCPVSTTQPHSSLSLPCFFYSPFLSCEWCRSMRIRVVQTARWLCDQH